MAAYNSDFQKTKKYQIAYGYLSSRGTTPPINKTITTQDAIKIAVGRLDLRNSYTEKTNDYGTFYTEYFTAIDGTLESVEKVTFGEDTLLQIRLLSEGELCDIAVKFYSKYTLDVLNRFISLKGKDISSPLMFAPYSIPDSFEIGGRKVDYNNQGIVIKINNNKVEKFYDAKKLNELAPKEEFTNREGKKEYSSVKRTDFLFEEAVAVLKELLSGENVGVKVVEKKIVPIEDKMDNAVEASSDDDSELPF